MAGSKEDVETVRAFFQDLRARGLGDPLLVVSDGAPGIIRAIEECFPRSARQRCLAHRMRNLAAKVSADPWPEFKARVTACYQAPSRAIARQLAAGIRADYANVLPSALACFEDDFEACIAHLRLPVTHRRFARTTNLLERLFVEERRRLKIIPNGFGEKPVLKLMFGALIRAAERWRGLRFTEFELRQIAAIRKELDDEYHDFNHAAGQVSPAPSFQQIQALTRRPIRGSELASDQLPPFVLPMRVHSRPLIAMLGLNVARGETGARPGTTRAHGKAGRSALCCRVRRLLVVCHPTLSNSRTARAPSLTLHEISSRRAISYRRLHRATPTPPRRRGRGRWPRTDRRCHSAGRRCLGHVARLAHCRTWPFFWPMGAFVLKPDFDRRRLRQSIEMSLQRAREVVFYCSIMATTRVQPAEARSILVGKQEIVKPSEGRVSRLCSFSIWQ